MADEGAAVSADHVLALDPPDSALPPRHESVVTVGCFDGVHLGHRYLVGHLAERARSRDRLAVAVTFEPHPRRILRPDQPLVMLTDAEERSALLRAAGADLVVTLRFTPALAAMSPEDFTALLVERARMRELWVGTDFALGRGRVGTVPVLREIGASQGFTVHTIEPFEVHGEVVKSSIVRQLLREGALEHANRLLGRAYDVVGQVVGGAGRGRPLGFPTANVGVPEDRLLPAHGVYAVRLQVAGEAGQRPGVANLGVRPSFGEQRVVLEVHLFDFGGDLYGQRVRVVFVERLREERRFASLDELRAQIARDAAQARAVLGAGAARSEKVER
ncbi:MAG: bifunctional riboflavin kinase/FAD synthetase [Chloroflexi bacterium]|nr:bifunctional riboflavin kinase/FAD synthetase [Chloroflexota bacterium]